MVEAFSTHGREDRCIQGLVVTSEGNGKFGGPKYRWQDNIKVDLKGAYYDKIEWIHVAQDREEWRAVLNMVMNLREISGLAAELSAFQGCGVIHSNKCIGICNMCTFTYILCFVLFVLCFLLFRLCLFLFVLSVLV